MKKLTPSKWQHLLKQFKNKINPPTTGDDGLKALIIAEAALKSVESGKKIQLNGLE